MLDEDNYNEEWVVVLSDTKARYTLSKNQARLLQEAFVRKEKAVVFETFIIALPFVVEFYRTRRFLKDAVALPETASEKLYQPMSNEDFLKWKEKIYQKIGK